MNGYGHMRQGMRDGCATGQDDEPLLWVPVERREHLYVPLFRVVVEGPNLNNPGLKAQQKVDRMHRRRVV